MSNRPYKTFPPKVFGDEPRVPKLALAVGLLFGMLYFVFLAVIVYVIVHFTRKYW